MMKKLLYYSASWCSPCRGFAPIMDELANQIPIEKVDVDKNRELVEKYHIKNIPTCVLVDNDVELKRFVGTKSKEDVLNFYNN